MNQQDRNDFAKLADQIETLTSKADALAKLEEVTPALVELARVQPTLTKLSQAYEAASWFTGFVKVMGAIAAAGLAIIAFWSLYLGDGKS